MIRPAESLNGVRPSGQSSPVAARTPTPRPGNLRHGPVPPWRSASSAISDPALPSPPAARRGGPTPACVSRAEVGRDEVDHREANVRRQAQPAPGHARRARPDALLHGPDRGDSAADRAGGGQPRQADRSRRVRGRAAAPGGRDRLESGRAAARRAARRRAGRPAGQGAHDQGQPAAGDLGGQEAHPARGALPRRGPGGQPGVDPGRGEVRLRQGLQVLHLRGVVDPPGHRAGHRRAGPAHPAAHARGGGGLQDRPVRPRAAAAAGARADHRGAGRGRQDAGTPGGRAAQGVAGGGQPGHAAGRRGRQPSR